MTEDHDWLDVRCSLFLADGAPRWPWPELAAALAEWQGEGRCTRWFFTRKPPGLRLRLHGPDLAALRAAVVAWLERVEAADVVRGWRFAVYEPETFRFGGPHGMAVAHRQFDRDSRAVLRFHLWPGRPPAALWTLVAVHALVRRVVDDGAEAWDVWKRLEQRVPAAARPTDPNLLTVAADALRGGGVLRGLGDPAAALLDDLARDADDLAAELHAAQAAGAMTVGPRAFLADLAQFHCNRMGHGPPALAELVALALACFEDA
jgi:thiopeptide-type bacteriocin biosynthesis protein